MSSKPGHPALSPHPNPRRVSALATLPLATLLLLTLLLPGPAGASEPSANANPDPVRIAEATVEAMGGEEAWDHVGLLSFQFAGRRSHHWDRSSGRHRVEGETQEGESYLVIHHLDTRQGRVWLDGAEIHGDRAAELLENAYGAWVNDTYWLLMPLKLTDPGVVLTYEGTEVFDGATYDVLGLAFEGVGLTPGDRYWAYIHRGTGLMDRWAYRLQSQPEDAEPTVWLWQDWEWYGPDEARVRLAPKRSAEAGGRTLELGPIEVSNAVPEALFTGP